MICNCHSNEDLIQIRIVRLNEKSKEVEGQEKKIRFTTKVLVHVLLWTRFSELELKVTGLENKKDIVDLKLDFIQNRINPLKNPIPTICTKEVEGDETKQNLLKFNDSDNNVLLVTINNIPTETITTGTRRTVIIYEETDILDTGL